ncbi:MAG: preprotein translocase subunit SecA, partial [Xanthobacteraceae bacterium]
IEQAAADLRTLSDAALRSRFGALREQVADGTAATAAMVPASALCCEAARRSLRQSPFAEQILCGVLLHQGHIVDMKNGEGKTLAATLPACLDALAGPVHIVTANDYLAARDAAWMAPLYRLLGLSVGHIKADLDDEARRRAYACDITYGAASEFGLDYLRDNTKYAEADQVQRGHAFAIVDEADAVLIDDAGTPLTLYGDSIDQSGFYRTIDQLVASLAPSHIEVDGKTRRAVLTEAGIATCEARLAAAGLLASASLFDVGNVALLSHLNEALCARFVLKRDVDYVVNGGEVVIVDRLSGRPLAGRRYADGLHQALEAKEGVAIHSESRTLASITFQNYFRLYRKLAGMTGTALTERGELQQIYGCDVAAVPPHLPVIRRDDPDRLFATGADKLKAVCDLVTEAHQRGQPVLVGTPSVEASEQLAGLLTQRGWSERHFAPDTAARAIGPPGDKTFAVLNARHHAAEAAIIAEAGLPGHVTIVTAMAGRGTDIRLGGRDGALAAAARAAGGLLVIGTERHVCRRFDDQLRGRTGRQGEPGRSVFFGALDDPLPRLFGAADKIMAQGAAADGSLSAAWLRKAIDRAQRLREATTFEARKTLLDYDDIIHAQRMAVYSRRNDILRGADIRPLARQALTGAIDALIDRFVPPHGPADLAGLDQAVRSELTLAVPFAPGEAGGARDLLRARITAYAERWLAGKFAAFGEATMDTVLRRLFLSILDHRWAEQIERLDHLRRVVGDRRLSRSARLPEFKIEAFEAFRLMMAAFDRDASAYMMRVGITETETETEREAASAG